MPDVGGELPATRLARLGSLAPMEVVAIVVWLAHALEVICESGRDARSDVYSLGAIA